MERTRPTTEAVERSRTVPYARYAFVRACEINQRLWSTRTRPRKHRIPLLSGRVSSRRKRSSGTGSKVVHLSVAWQRGRGMCCLGFGALAKSQSTRTAQTRTEVRHLLRSTGTGLGFGSFSHASSITPPCCPIDVAGALKKPAADCSEIQLALHHDPCASRVSTHASTHVELLHISFSYMKKNLRLFICDGLNVISIWRYVAARRTHEMALGQQKLLWAEKRRFYSIRVFFSCRSR